MAFADLIGRAGGAARDLLGAPVRYVPETGDAVEVRGVFDLEYRRPDDSQPGVAAVGPACWVALADLPDDPATSGAAVEYLGVRYRIREVQTDGLGEALLHLLRI